MKRFVVLGLLVLGCSPDHADAGGCAVAVRKNVVVANGEVANHVVANHVVANHVVANGFALQQFAALPFAVPVGIPVAQVTAPQFAYSYGAETGYQVKSGLKSLEEAIADRIQVKSGLKSLEEAIADRIAAKLGANVNGGIVTPSSTSLVGKRCAKCHNGPDAKAGFSVIGELAEADRLKAIRLVLSDDPAKRMPKGVTLSAEEIGLLIQELAKAP